MTSFMFCFQCSIEKVDYFVCDMHVVYCLILLLCIIEIWHVKLKFWICSMLSYVYVNKCDGIMNTISELSPWKRKFGNGIHSSWTLNIVIEFLDLFKYKTLFIEVNWPSSPARNIIYFTIYSVNFLSNHYFP